MSLRKTCKIKTYQITLLGLIQRERDIAERPIPLDS